MKKVGNGEWAEEEDEWVCGREVGRDGDVMMMMMNNLESAHKWDL